MLVDHLTLGKALGETFVQKRSEPACQATQKLAHEWETGKQAKVTQHVIACCTLELSRMWLNDAKRLKILDA